MVRLCRRIVESTLREDDTPEERNRKEIWIPICTSLGVLSTVFVLLRIDRSPRAGEYAIMAAFCIYIVSVSWPLLTKRLPLHFVGVLTTLCSLCAIMMDLSAAARMKNFRPWTWIVLSMDMFLALNVPTMYQRLTLMMISFWIMLFNVESAYRLGLYDIEGFSEAHEEAATACSCTRPPCGHGFTELFEALPTLAVLLTDYAATRGFAEGLRAEQAKMVSAVRVSEQVATMLAAYATEDARRVVAEEGAALPDALRASYQQLLDNLDKYRAYLPDALLYAAQHQRQGSSCFDSEPPLAASPVWVDPPGDGQDSAEVALCFTDVQSSTELWETYPQGMYEGLDLHNRVMRDTYSACNGYEVKTIGDSFMVAFARVLDALQFGLEAQLRLVRQQWPADLLCHPLCQWLASPTGQVVWCGLRVRIGAHSGPVHVERNPVTGRCDYFGHTVNAAARLEAVLGKGGFVATMDTVVAQIGEEGLRDLGAPVVHDAGGRELKGIKEMVQVRALVPQSLKQRINVLTGASSKVPLTPTRRFTARSAFLQTTPQLPEFSDSCSSGGSAVTTPRMPSSTMQSTRRVSCRPAADAAALRLQQSGATCAAVRVALSGIEPVARNIGHFAAGATLAADQTQGVVDSLLSACVLVSWNASRPCADHTAACRQFIGAQPRDDVHLGAASGGVLSGSVSAGRRSFTTVIGSIVELATALAEEAERCGDAALACGAIADACVAAGTAFCAQIWEPAGGAQIVVYEIDAKCDEDDEKWLLGGDDALERSRRADPSAVPELFLRACAAPRGSPEHVEVLRALQRERDGGPDNGPAARLAARAAASTARRRPMPPLWEPVGARRTGPAGSVAVLPGASLSA